ncbi:MAG TPA: antitoxin Xre/MbcA/ParS toxin-binding domain-containing protein [Gammaproteobacteria bacterium]|nr:antitoxin Xre/MbcA/ParS toxin-binding domain-containing protein [Gammaproteobacteria bacterium]
MAASLQNLLNDLKDPLKEMNLVRNGLATKVIESFLAKENLLVKDILERLHIPSSTYFSKKKNQQPLDTYTTEKFVRLISILMMASDILGKNEAKNWIYRNVPSLGNQAPVNLLDTEVGHRLAEQALLQIKYGMYA